MRDYVKRLLSQYYEVETVTNGLEALKAIAQRLPDLLLSDVMMPKLDGFELLRELRANPHTEEIPIILLSARAGEESRIEGLKAGADDYLVKPFSARELLARVEATLKLGQIRKVAARQEQALRVEAQAARDSLDNVLARIADQFLALDRDWRYTYVNDRVIEVTGIDRENLLGRSIWELFPDIAGSQFDVEVRRAVAEQIPVQFEYFYSTWNRWFENHVYPSTDGVSIIITEITDRIQAEIALRESEQKYRSLFESIDQGFCLIEILFNAADQPFDYRFIEVNAAFERQSGLVNVVGKTILDFVPHLEPQWIERNAQVAKSGAAIRFEADVTAMNCTFDVYAFPIGTPNQNLVAILFADITQRKRREANLAFLAEIQDDCARPTTADAMMQTVGAKIGSYMNLSICAFVDIDEAQDQAIVTYSWHRTDVPNLVGTYRISEFLSEAFHVEARTGRIIVVNDVTTDQRTDAANHIALNIQSFIHAPFLRDGQWKFLFNVYDSRPRVWREDEIELFSELANHIFPRLERARAEAALKESEARYRLLAEAIPQLVWITDANGQNEYVNQRFCDYTGLTAEQMRGLKWLSILHPDDLEMTCDRWLAAVHSGQFYEIEYRFRRFDGSYRWFLGQGIPMKDEQGHIYKWFGTCTDIEPQKQLEQTRLRLLEQEQSAREQAETANRIKDEFLAVLSHELRSPLNPILGWSKLLRSGKLDATKTSLALETIERNAQLQVQLIDDLLDISRILRGKLTLTVAPIDLSFVISAALETVRLAAEAKSLQIQTILSPTVITVNGDAGRLQQVIWNLLSNAVKFTPQGGRVEVRLEQIERGRADDWKGGRGDTPHYPSTHPPIQSYAQITVTDTGKGIKPDFLPYVFEHFRQEDGATTRKFGGLGLGLAIARQIIEMHGGYISVDSPGEGQGATFTVHLPLALPSSQLPLPKPSLASSSDLSGIYILVVDDEPDSRDFAAFVLEQAGAIVTHVSSGIEALQAIEQFTPNLIVSDVGMPEMDGYMLLRHLRAHWQSLMGESSANQVPAIALTAYAGEFDRQQAIAAGFQMHLTKPIEPEELINAIVNLLKERGNNAIRFVQF
jgi:PAS domain S-box-containing protein